MTGSEAAIIVARIFTIKEAEANGPNGDWSASEVSMPVVWLRRLRDSLRAEGITDDYMKSVGDEAVRRLFRELR